MADLQGIGAILTPLCTLGVGVLLARGQRNVRGDVKDVKADLEVVHDKVNGQSELLAATNAATQAALTGTIQTMADAAVKPKEQP